MPYTSVTLTFLLDDEIEHPHFPETVAKTLARRGVLKAGEAVAAFGERGWLVVSENAGVGTGALGEPSIGLFDKWPL